MVMNDATPDTMTDHSVWDWRLGEFRDRTASDAPTPGGGSAAMVSATIGLGLVLMALRVTARRPETGDALMPLIESGERRIAELSGHADADIAVFEAYMQALRMPRGTDAEKAARREALAQATIAATEVPLNAAQSALEGLDLACQAVHVAHANIVSDVAAGAALLHGAVTAVLYSVDINLKSIADAAVAEDYARSRAHLQEAAGRRHASITAAIAKRLG
jgi:formiminotetrahydrofolate cyclodeaminase